MALSEVTAMALDSSHLQDLAIDLRVRLGDWFRVIQLAHGANEDGRAKEKVGLGLSQGTFGRLFGRFPGVGQPLKQTTCLGESSPQHVKLMNLNPMSHLGWANGPSRLG